MTEIHTTPLAIYFTGCFLAAFLFLHQRIRCPAKECRLARWTDATIEDIGGAVLHAVFWPLILLFAFFTGPEN